jgi:hypothetical protein
LEISRKTASFQSAADGFDAFSGLNRNRELRGAGHQMAMGRYGTDRYLVATKIISARYGTKIPGQSALRAGDPPEQPDRRASGGSSATIW